MIPELGQFALIVALLLAITAGVLPLVGAARGITSWTRSAWALARAQCGFVTMAFGCLTVSFIDNDFSVAYVASNSNSMLPLIYRFAAVWGGHEGSLLLWTLLLTWWMAAVSVFSKQLPMPMVARVLGVMSWINVGFLLFMLVTSNPFTRLLPPAMDGRDLNPLLQDPGMVSHPPILYMGYVGFAVAFSFAVSALLSGELDAAWARWSRPWTTAAWTFLTLRIMLGSGWAYYELGWGGWWFWDPVENASFMPWLVGTALIHSSIVVEKRDTLRSWTVLLAIITFSLSLVGTFLVRSGVLTSVHAFATDPERGTFILLLLVAAIGGSLTLYAIRAPALKGGGLFAPISREGALVVNNLLLATAAATVFLGTLYPLFLDAIGGGKVSVGPAFFNATFVPLMAPLLAAMVFGPLLAWKRGDLGGALGRLGFAAAAAVVVGLVVWWLRTGGPVGSIFGMALAAWIAVGTLVEYGERIKLFGGPLGQSWRRARSLPRAAYGMTIAHFGVAVLVAGVTASAWQVERVETMRPGDSIDVAGYSFRFDGAKPVAGPNYTAQRGRFTVTSDGREIAIMQPEKRFYPVRRMPITDAAIHTNGFADLYAVMSEQVGIDGAWVMRLYYNPLVPWIWFGAIIMALGGLVSLSDRRLRIGAPARRTAASPVVPARA